MVTVSVPPAFDIETPLSTSAFESAMAMWLAPVLVRLTVPWKSLPALPSPMLPAPALMVTAPVPVTTVPPTCCTPTEVVVSAPDAAGVMLTPDSVSRPTVRMPMALAPVLVRLVAPAKLLPVLLSVMAPFPELMIVAPVPVTIAPVCVNAPLVVTTRPPVAVGVIETLLNTSAPASQMAMVLAPVLARLTAPRKSLPAFVSVIAAAPAVMTDVPPTVSGPDCVIAPVKPALLLNEVATRLRPTLPLPRFRLPLERTVRS